MFIKICANTNLEDAWLAAELGADAVGFVFAKSKRQVTAETVAAIIAELPVGAEKVGVFDLADAVEIEDVVVSAGLTVVQLHGAFDASRVRALAAKFGGNLNIIQTVAYAVDAVDRAAADEQFESTLRSVFDEAAVWAVLIDAAKSGVSGGLGVAFDWAHVAEIVERAVGEREPRPRVILAGGLDAYNVAEAIAAMKPWGVDVASGVEAAPGKKDPERLREFLVAARRAGLPRRR
ncbi:MAG TPA: phosphoribosylanthranilate isomerase [Acidobacteriaceae bacterium]